MRPARYSVHKFIGRKPHDLIASLIARQTGPGEVILDPFVGSGTTACEALVQRRRVIANDLDPFAVFLARMLCISPIDLGDLDKAYARVRDEVEERIMDLYSLEEKCGRCGARLVSHWVIRDKSMVVRPICPQCLDWPATRNRKLTMGEMDRLSKIESEPEPDDEGSWVGSRFSGRSRLALRILSNSIGQQRREFTGLLRYVFSANLAKSSLLNTFRKDGKRWILSDPHRLSIPVHPLEFNAWMGFQNRYTALLRAKAETNHLIGTWYDEPGHFATARSSATRMDDIGDEAVHHIITDPPYSETISYSDLHRINRHWLGLGGRLEGEITLGPGSGQDSYLESMRLALGEMARVLKPRGSLTMVMEGGPRSERAYISLLETTTAPRSLTPFATQRVMHLSKPYLIVRSIKRGA